MAYSSKGTLNRMQVIGRIGNDLEVRHTQSGKKVLNLSVATNERAGNEDVTTWHRAVLWEKKAEICNQYCRKGSKILVEGCLQARKYTDREGVERTNYEIDVENLVLLDSKDSNGGGRQQGGGGQQQGGWGGGGQQGGGQRQQAPVDDDEDIPF